MAYQATTYSSMHDLLLKIKIFLEANGWTTNLYTGDTTSYMSHASFDYTGGYRLHVQKAAADATVMYFNFRSITAGIIFDDHSTSQQEVNDFLYNELRGIGFNGSTGYNVANNWDQQPGAPTAGTTGKFMGACIQDIPNSGSYNVYLFQNGDTVVVVAEQSSGFFQWMAFGCLAKAGSYTGGQFYSASCASAMCGANYNTLGSNLRNQDRIKFMGWVYPSCTGSRKSSTAVYHNGDSDLDWRHNAEEGMAGNVEKAYKLNTNGFCPYHEPDTYYHGRHLSSFVYTRTPNAFNGMTVLVPLYFFTRNVNSRWNYLGVPEGLRAINMSLLAPAAEMTFGADTWKAFPAHAKSESGTDNLAGEVGFAVKKV